MQIKKTLRLHFTPGRIAIIKNITNNRCWWEQVLVGMQARVTTLEKNMEAS
jgi:hypothetical protein